MTRIIRMVMSKFTVAASSVVLKIACLGMRVPLCAVSRAAYRMGAT